MPKTQRQRILDNAQARTHTMSDGVQYKGANPLFVPKYNELGDITGVFKAEKGIPFVKIEDKDSEK